MSGLLQNPVFSGRIIYFLGEYSIMEEELVLFVEPICQRGDAMKLEVNRETGILHIQVKEIIKDLIARNVWDPAARFPPSAAWPSSSKSVATQ